MQKTKEIIFMTLTFLIILLIIFVTLELISREMIGNRLIVKVEPDGLYNFEPNQYGWYSHLLRIPPARINNIGARGEDINLSSINSTKKFIFLGDSFTFGWEMNESETVPYYFQKEFPSSYTVINYANGGYGIDHMISSWNFHKSLLNNGVVIITLIEDDFYRPMDLSAISPLKEKFWKIKEKSSSIAWAWAAFFGTLDQWKNKTRSPEGLDVFNVSGDKLLNFSKQLKSENKTLIFVFYELNKTIYSDYSKSFCQKNNLSCITNIYSIPPAVQEEGNPIFTPDNWHPSEYINKLVAQRLANYIKENPSFK